MVLHRLTRANVFYTIKSVKKRVSIADVALLAGVSISTVSRVINNTGYPVSKEVQERIRKAVKQLNYTPSLAAQHLRSDFNPVIGLIVRDIADIYFGEIAKGATEKAMELGYLSFVCNTGRNPDNEMQFHELLWKNRVRGILLIGGGIDTPEYKSLLEKQLDRCNRFGLRIVASAPQGLALPTITTDIISISRSIIDYFFAHGHRTIGLISGEPRVLTSKDHLFGYKEALLKANIPFDSSLVQLSSFTEKSGYAGCVELLQHKPRPTAICCGCDPIAVGVLHALNDASLEVPRDISLISIGDTPIACHLRPALTSVHVPRYQLGARAVETILNENYSLDYTEYLSTELIERESVSSI